MCAADIRWRSSMQHQAQSKNHELRVCWCEPDGWAYCGTIHGSSCFSSPTVRPSERSTSNNLKASRNLAVLGSTSKGGTVESTSRRACSASAGGSTRRTRLCTHLQMNTHAEEGGWIGWHRRHVHRTLTPEHARRCPEAEVHRWWGLCCTAGALRPSSGAQ